MRLIAALVLLWPVLALAEARPPEAIAGFWQTEGDEAVIQIRVEGHDFPGTIVWLAEDHYPADDPRGMGGQIVVDRDNPDPAKRNRPLIGLTLLKNLDYHVSSNDPDNAEARWINGRIYDSERGKWYDCNLWLADADHLKVHGYIGVPLLGKTTTWTRVADPARQAPVPPGP